MAKKKITPITSEEVAEIAVIIPPEAIAKKKVEDVLEKAGQALKDNDLVAYGDAYTELEKEIKDYNAILAAREYDKLLSEPCPMISAVKQFYMPKWKIVETTMKDSKTISGIGIEEGKARINLEKLCERGDLPKKWAKDCSKLLTLLSIRETNVYEVTPAELAKKSFYFASVVRAKKEGETPDSNTQIVRLLQTIIDEAIFVDDGTGKNKYKCTSHDIAFIQDAVTSMDTKEKCTIKMLNERQFKNVMMGVFAHCLGEKYQVKAAKVKEEE